MKTFTPVFLSFQGSDSLLFHYRPNMNCQNMWGLVNFSFTLSLELFKIQTNRFLNSKKVCQCLISRFISAASEWGGKLCSPSFLEINSIKMSPRENENFYKVLLVNSQILHEVWEKVNILERKLNNYLLGQWLLIYLINALNQRIWNS